MKNQLKYLLPVLLLLSMLCYTGCKEDDDPVDPLELLPPLTNTGENTFGCLVNGEAFVTESFLDAVAIIQGGFLQMFGIVKNDNIDQDVFITLQNPKPGTYEIGSADCSAEYRDLKMRCKYNAINNSSGFFTISTYDTENYIISGTFEFTSILNKKDSDGGCQDTVRVTDGRFDIKYIP